MAKILVNVNKKEAKLTVLIWDIVQFGPKIIKWEKEELCIMSAKDSNLPSCFNGNTFHKAENTGNKGKNSTRNAN